MAFMAVPSKGRFLMKNTPMSSNQFAAAKFPLAKRFALAVVVSGALSACVAEDPPSRPPPTTGPYTYTCTVSITPGSFEYRVEGDVLQIIVPGQVEEYERVASGEPGNPVFGTWHILTQSYEYGTATLDMEIAPDRVTAISDCDFGSVSAVAEASSRAVITDTSITTLDYAEDVEVVYGD
jgi:hypothetical protein